jgi:signal transduction histidine kinase/CheY-like chemotaxis protein
MKIKEWNIKKRIPVLAAAVLLIVVIAVVYTRQLAQTVSDNIIQNISELAEHDQNNIRYYVEATWKDLEYIAGKFSSYHCETIEEIETQMNVECSNSDFSHIYLVGTDGKVYTDNFLTYDPDKDGQNGRIDLLPYFENGEDYIVSRFDDKVVEAGITRESILYGIRLKDFTVQGVSMAALAGISDISKMQDRLTINSFMKNGVSRGYSSVIDTDGNYIVNVEQTVYLNEKDNFFEGIENSRTSDLTSQEIAEKMRNVEQFCFYYTNAEGTERIVYCMPFEEEGIPWYFLSSVETTVFSEQNHSLLAMSMGMLAGIVVVIILVLIFVMISQHKVIVANAEAKARSVFLANMSHEIRTPLNGIIGMLFLMEKDLDSGQEQTVIRQRLTKTQETAEYLLSLINNILDVSKLQAGKVSVNDDTVSPDSITDAIWSMQKNNIENRGIRFAVEKEITVPWIIGDELMIKQVLMNILSNAAKFTPSGGQITLSVTQKAEEPGRVSTIFTCADTGCGMSEGFLDHIWDSFSQERSSNEESIKGTGLGMAISKLLVDAMGGELTVKSKLGEGSTFSMILHSRIAPHAPDIHRDSKVIPAVTEQEHRPLRILVAEDNELNAEILTEILEDEGFEVICAPNGQAAVEQFRSSAVGEIQVILMDMQMPVMDGCEATKEIRSMDRADAGKVSVFACTANNFNEDRERAETSGMNDFLSKPIDVRELLKKLEGSF